MEKSPVFSSAFHLLSVNELPLYFAINHISFFLYDLNVPMYLSFLPLFLISSLRGLKSLFFSFLHSSAAAWVPPVCPTSRKEAWLNPKSFITKQWEDADGMGVKGWRETGEEEGGRKEKNIRERKKKRASENIINEILKTFSSDFTLMKCRTVTSRYPKAPKPFLPPLPLRSSSSLSFPPCASLPPHCNTCLHNINSALHGTWPRWSREILNTLRPAEQSDDLR